MIRAVAESIRDAGVVIVCIVAAFLLPIASFAAAGFLAGVFARCFRMVAG